MTDHELGGATIPLYDHGDCVGFDISTTVLRTADPTWITSSDGIVDIHQDIHEPSLAGVVRAGRYLVRSINQSLGTVFVELAT